MYETIYHETDLGNIDFLVTGGAGFIGSNMVEYLLKYGARKVRVLDNFSTGSRRNIEAFMSHPAFELMEGDIRDPAICLQAVAGMQYVSHQAALGSVPRSIQDPLTTNAVNITGFLNMLYAVKEAGNIKRFVYAASSSTYGDSKELPKVEERIGKPLSPYAVTKYVNELYADVFAKTYSLELVGLRYFNVFGPRQSPDGAYAAVIPLFIKAIKENAGLYIDGDGEQTRDFTFVENVIQANIRALFVTDTAALNQVYNVACGERISLNSLVDTINHIAGENAAPIYRSPRKGDVRDSLADISNARKYLGYAPAIDLRNGLEKTINANGPLLIIPAILPGSPTI